VRVPTRLMAGARRVGASGASSDPIDAWPSARAALRERPPVVRLDGEARELRLLVDHRDDLVKERTKLQRQAALAPPRALPRS